MCSKGLHYSLFFFSGRAPALLADIQQKKIFPIAASSYISCEISASHAALKDIGALP